MKLRFPLLMLVLGTSATSSALARPHHARTPSHASPPVAEAVLLIDAVATDTTPERVYAAPGGAASEACAQQLDFDVPGDRGAHRPAVRVVLPDALPPAPPAARTHSPSPGAGFVWLDGYFGWTGQRYVWVDGRWDLSPLPGAVRFEPEHWQRTADRTGWTYTPSRWIAP